jgi:hypothetical protein
MLGLRTGCLMLALCLSQSVEGATEQTGPLKMTTHPAKLVATPSSPRLQDFLAAFELKRGLKRLTEIILNAWWLRTMCLKTINF